MGKFTNRLNERLKRQHPGYKRELMQTYFTAPEWRNVEMAEELGNSLAKGRPFYRYPYFRQIATFWAVFKTSYGVARKHHSHMSLITSEYMMMNLFVGISTTVGFMALGLWSLLLSPLLKNQNNTEFQKHIGKEVKSYAKFIHTIPFYNYPYFSKLKTVWRDYRKSKHRTLADLMTFGTVTIELLARGVLSAPIAWWYNQPNNQVPQKTHLLIKNTKQLNFKDIDKDVKLIKSYKQTKNHKTRYYSHVTVPRYAAFQRIIFKLLKKRVHIKKVAAQDAMQFKILAQQNQSTEKFNLLYAYRNHIDNKKYLAVDVPVSKLNQTLKNITNKGMKLKFMHDF